eukprot:6050582-Amphidinium_carterae.2
MSGAHFCIARCVSNPAHILVWDQALEQACASNALCVMALKQALCTTTRLVSLAGLRADS